MGEFQDGAAVEENPVQYETLNPDQLSKKMFEIVNDVNAVFQVRPMMHPYCVWAVDYIYLPSQLPTPHVRILLTTCKWDKEKLLERYFKTFYQVYKIMINLDAICYIQL